ncbi:MAG: cytidylate kinase family protein [DPANN group archaeon]|nr:cytidylate kinase family protein [DPANN group archaeon]
MSGPPGAGDTTTARILAKKLNYFLLEIGEVGKHIAQEQGYNIAEFWEQIKKHPDKLRDFNETIDKKQTEIVKSERNVIVNSKLGAYKLNADLKIFINAPLQVRAERVAEREDIPLNEARERITKREKSEKEEWLKLYGIDMGNLSVYDLVINSGKLTAEDTADIILEYLQKIKAY